MRKLFFLVTILLTMGMQVVYAQTTIKGTVTDENSDPIPGANVSVKGFANQGTITDLTGTFTIEIPQGATSLIVSFIGMKTQEIEIGEQTTIDVSMKNEDVGIDEVIVVAYGTAKKTDFTGSAVKISSESLELRPVTNLTTALEGASPGVQVTAPGGQPGSTQSIRIRGTGSYNVSNEPLYVVDGAPFMGELSSINPNDIESMTILKDAASTALYGNKASNGVVMITTKSGKNKKGRLSLNISTGITSRAQPEYKRLNAFEYYPMMWEALRNQRISAGDDLATANQRASDDIFGDLEYNPFNVANDQIVGTDGRINPAASYLGTYGEDLDWDNAVISRGFRQNYDLNYMGGTEKTDFYVSVGYLDETGYIKNSNFKRFSGRANVNSQITDWFKTGLNVSGTFSKGNQAQTGTTQSGSFVNPIRFTRSMGPIYPVYEHDLTTGEYVLDNTGNKVYDFNGPRPSGASGGRHVVAEIDWNTDLDEISSIGARTFAEVKFLKNFSFSTNLSFDQRNLYTSNFENKYVGDGAPGGRATRDFSRRNSVNFYQLLNYSKTFGKHSVSALLGHESLNYTFSYLEGNRSNVIADGNSELINFTTTTNLASAEFTYRNEGYFARLNYDLDDKYFVSASYRKDGSSKFSEENRWGDFWSIGGAWRIDQESFAKDIDWMNVMKLRASYGQLGVDGGKINERGTDQGLEYYAYQALFELDYNNQSEPGFRQKSLAAKELVWESSNSSSIALEFGVFNRVFGTVEFYHRISKDLLFAVPLPVSSGLESKDENVGTLLNYGIEFSVGVDIIKTTNFKWNLNLNVSTNKNEFTKLPDGQDEIIDDSKKLKVGHSRYEYWLKDWYGVDPADGSALYRADLYDDTDTDIRIFGTDTLTTDQSNARYHYAGSAIPDFYGSITNTLSYKSFELSFMFTYSVGGEILDYNYQSIMSSGTYGTALSVDILDRWQNPGDITDIPRMDASETTNFNATSDRWLTSASFLNLRRINIAYSLPQNLLSKMGISSTRVYASAENLFLLNARKGMNSQQRFSGTTSNVYTPSKVFTLGLNITF